MSELCYGEFPGFYNLQHYRQRQHDFPIGTQHFDLDDANKEVADFDNTSIDK